MFSNMILAFYIALFSLSFAGALPYDEGSVARRQVASPTLASPLTAPTTIVKTSTVQTANGPMNQTCVYTFTPDGNQIQEVTNCTIVASGSQVSSTLITPTSTMNSSAAGSADTSVPATASAQAAFTIPGRSMQVLPVGIGVFGTITAITIIVVVLVTLERVRYRKVFRQRRLAEQGAMMGMGGSFRDKV